MDRVSVLCLVSRMIGDTSYTAGEHYTLPTAQAEKYATTGYFRILSVCPAGNGCVVLCGGDHCIEGAGDITAAEDAAHAKMAPHPENKIMRGKVTKGLPARDGETRVNLDGSPVPAGVTMERP